MSNIKWCIRILRNKNQNKIHLLSKTKYGCGIRNRVEDNHAYSEGRRRSPEEYGSNVHRIYNYTC